MVVGPYSFGSSANDLLGFEHYQPDTDITPGDGTYLLVFASGDSVVAEVALYGQAFYFLEGVTAIDGDNAQTTVVRDDGEIILVPS